MTELLFLGPPGVATDAGWNSVGSATAEIVFAVLGARPGVAVPVESIQRAVWGEDRPSTAGSSLRSHIVRLRRRLAEVGSTATIVARPLGGTPGYALITGDDEVDHVVFEAELAQARRLLALRRPAEALEVLERALGRWYGEPFEGLDLPDLVPIAEGLDRSRRDALELFGETGLLLGRHDLVATVLADAAADRPDRERLTALAMRALYRSGRQREALQAYQHTRQWLAEHLGVEPTEPLRRLELQILEHDPILGSEPRSPTPVRPVELPAPLAAQRRGVFVGRCDELDAMDPGPSRDFSATIITGPAGIGKSRLAAEHAARLAWPEVTVLAGWCRVHTAAPFHLFEPALRQLADSGPLANEAIRQVLEAMDVGGSPDRRTRRLISLLDGLLARLSDGPQRVLLVLEDLHWIDSSSQLALDHVLRSAPAGLRVVGTGRSDRSNPNWARLLSDLTGYPAVDHLALGGLREHELVELVEAQPGAEHADAAALARFLEAKTAGNPYYVRALLGADRGLLAADGAELADRSRSTALPTPVADQLAARLDPLPPDVRSALEVAAVLGNDFSLDDARAVLEAVEPGTPPAFDRSEGLDAVVTLGLIEPTGLGPDRAGYRFEHDLLREATLARVPADRLRRLHAAAATVAQARDADPIIVARHQVAALPLIEPAPVVESLRRAADRSYERLALLDAARLYRTALDLLTDSHTFDPSLRVDLLVGRALAEQRLGDRRSMLDDLEVAMDAAEELGLIDKMADIGVAVSGLGPTVFGDELAARLLRRAYDSGAGTQDERDAFVIDLLTQIVFSDGVTDEAVALFDDAFGGDDPPRPAHLYADLVMMAGSPEAGLRLARARALIARTSRDVHGEIWIDAHHVALAALMDLGDTVGAEAVLDVYEEEAAARFDAYSLWLAIACRGDLALLRGSFDEAARRADEALEFGVANGIVDAEFYLYGHVLVRTFLERDMKDLLGVVDTPEFRDSGVIGWRAALALLLADAHQTDEALSVLSEVVDTLEVAPFDPLRPISLATAAQACIDLGADQLAGRLLTMLEPYGGLMIQVSQTGAPFGPADRLLAGLLRLLGRPGEADRRLRAAIDLASAAGSPPWVRRCRDDADLA